VATRDSRLLGGRHCRQPVWVADRGAKGRTPAIWYSFRIFVARNNRFRSFSATQSGTDSDTKSGPSSFRTFCHAKGDNDAPKDLQCRHCRLLVQHKGRLTGLHTLCAIECGQLVVKRMSFSARTRRNLYCGLSNPLPTIRIMPAARPHRKSPRRWLDSF